ncbi:MAG: DUF58 domain-containing protein [Myxococcales bacterium]|nr:MAG: DUF58 domain-containing protein [Myxococcales bacterium]
MKNKGSSKGKLLKGIARTTHTVRNLFPLSSLGFSLLVLAPFALQWWGLRQMDLVVLVLSYSALALLGFSVLSTVTVALLSHLRLRRLRCKALSLETCLQVETDFALKAVSWLPWVDLRWQWYEPNIAELDCINRSRVLHERVRLLERGQYKNLKRRFFIQDILGLSRIVFESAQLLELKVLPWTGALDRSPLLSAYAGGEDLAHPRGLAEGDRVELRRYNPGDPARLIHWKLFARTRKLMTRFPERAFSKTTKVLAYLVEGPNDDASAAVARVAIEQQALGEDWLFGADGSSELAVDVAKALELIQLSKQRNKEKKTELRQFVSAQRKLGFSSLLVFCPPTQQGEWLEQLRECISEFAAGVHVVIGIDGAPQEHPPKLLTRFLFNANRSDVFTKTELQELLISLKKMGASVDILDRKSGDSYLHSMSDKRELRRSA